MGNISPMSNDYITGILIMEHEWNIMELIIELCKNH